MNYFEPQLDILKVPTKELQKLLDKLELSDTDSICYYDEMDKLNTSISSETLKKINKIKPDAFYIFNGVPYILFFDLSTGVIQKDREAEIHKQAWSFDQSPLVFIIREKDVEVFNAFSFDKKTNTLEKVKISKKENIEDVFSFWKLQSGASWEWLQKNCYSRNIQEKRVNQKLFENIRFVRETLTNKQNEDCISEDEANILILRLIFIRYLIDRNVKLDESYIFGSTLNDKRKSFVDLIAKPRKLNDFFEWLNDKFNGVLFKDTKITLSKERSSQLAQVFGGEIAEGIFQRGDFYFDIFDFSIIPVELISGIYESLIDEKTRELHSAVYTPSFLVEYILTNTIDGFIKNKKNRNISECKVFDPSVGSGIFLVQAFRRMVDKEILLSGDKKVSRKRLKEIVCSNLYGIDINEQALKVTCFSIYIAMLDYFEPNSILPKFEFPNLIGSNLFEANFFDTEHEFNDVVKEAGIDFILGNPPWKSNKDDIHVNWLKSSNEIVGRYEIAQSFLLRSKDFMQSNTISALIVTSTIFYNVAKTTKAFKYKFLKTFCIDIFFDLSAVRRLVFAEKNNPCSIVFYKLSKNDNYIKNILSHYSVKSNLFLKYYKSLVIEKFDQKKIAQRHFIENDWMFKVALYGNTLDFNLLKKLELTSKRIIDLVDDVEVFKGAGIERGKDGKYYPRLENLTIIENGEVTPYVSNADNLRKLSFADTFLSRGRRIEIFDRPKILFKEQNEDESEPLISLLAQACVFRKGISSLSTSNEILLKRIYSYVISDLYVYFLFIKSCSWGVSTRPQTRLDEEYLSFPYKVPNHKVERNLVALVNKFVKPFEEFYSKFSLGEPVIDSNILAEINSLVNDIYNINGYEKDIIDYVLKISRYQFQESKQQKVIRKVHHDNNVLEAYADVFFMEFEKLYPNEYLQVQVYTLNHFIAMNFTFSVVKPDKNIVLISSDKESEVFSIIANKVSISEVSQRLYVQKDIKGFESDSFYIIKPNEYKCWHRAMAWYDVAEIKQTIEEAEIIYLNNNLDA